MHDSGDQEQKLSRELTRIFDAGHLPLTEIDIPPQELLRLGFLVDAQQVSVPADLEWLDANLIRAALSDSAQAWLRELNVFRVTGSTSTVLLQRAATETIAGVVNTAELQIAGRGRRGRMWMSPIGQNLALSAGLTLPIVPAAMGGFSLCVGLAVVDVLEQAGIKGVALKWPNDVLLNGHKLAGVLIDLNAHPTGCEVVVGIGMNLRLPVETREDIDQPAADLASARIGVSRNQLTGALISSLLDYAGGFVEKGFVAMRSAFDAHHSFHGHECVILQGSESISGIVRGVGVSGELLLDTAAGERAFSAGEVSLRGQI
jgi:BirA family transcriptional regulator, biotin operon repressor / biotin---[acetyl-CoA-carboxylase] ligase